MCELQVGVRERELQVGVCELQVGVRERESYRLV